MAEACLSSQVQRLIYTGTIDSYYAGARAGMITEATPLDPQIAWRNLYARAKAASEDILLAMHRERALPVTIFRPGIVIGRGGSPFHWGIGMWSWNAVCQVWGQGRNPLPLVLVEDVAQALVSALDAPKIEGESFNLVAETDITALDYLRALEDYAGVSFQKFPTPPWKFYATDLVKWVVKQMVRHPDQRKPSYRDWETRTQQARYDCTKARNLLNWRPVCDRDEIIRRGIQLPASEFLPSCRHKIGMGMSNICYSHWLMHMRRLQHGGLVSLLEVSSHDSHCNVCRCYASLPVWLNGALQTGEMTSSTAVTLT